ncbi:MAG TPA: hypothetical protein VFV49_06140, partial [Thermoanaerobaculia bacterium]|nr:hypothetical protein [Thermoanaerobaculia bacterium]
MSPFVLEDRLECSTAAVASDGDDFLIVCERFDEGTWGQIIADGTPAGPLFLIGNGMGTGASAVWNGSSYVVAWCAEDFEGTFATTVSRNGSVGEPVKIHDRWPVALAANGDRVMFAVNTGGEVPRNVVGGLLDENARPRSAPAVLFANHSGGHSLTATNAGFALGTFGHPQTSLTLFDHDGKPKGAPILIDGPYRPTTTDYHAGRGVVASDGENVLMTFHATEYEKLSELRTAIVASDGTIRRVPATIAVTTPTAGASINPMSIVWNGSAYVALLSLVTGFHNAIPAWTRIAPNGDRIGDVTPLADSYGHFANVAFNGRENLVAYTDRITGSAGVATPLYALADPGTASPRTPFRSFGRTVAPHLEIAIGATPSQYLATWTEEYGDAWRVRASRIDSNGRYLDGAGLILGTVGFYHSLAVDSDGSNWLVVWADGGPGAGTYHGPVRAMRISSTGVLLDPQPIELGPGDEASVRRGKEGWMVVATDRSSLVAIPVSRDGLAGARRTIHEAVQGPQELVYYSNPVVAFDGTTFIAGASHHREIYESSDTHFAVTRIDANGVPLDGPPALLGESSPWSGLALATNGETSMAFFSKLPVSWQIPGQLFGVLLPSRTEF